MEVEIASTTRRAEHFHQLSHRGESSSENADGVSANFNSGTFGRITTQAGDPRTIQLGIRGHEGPDLYLMFNADMTLASFVLPELRAGVWRLAIDTSQPSEDADPSARDGCEVKGALYALGSRSSAILVATE